MKGLVEVTHLTQMVDFPTWSRTINGVIKESMIDHIYIKKKFSCFWNGSPAIPMQRPFFFTKIIIP